MREKDTLCELEDLWSRVDMEDVCSVCLKNVAPSRAVTKIRSNGVVPHQSRVLACSPRSHLGLCDSGITKALITGGAGYLGHRLACALIESGISVLQYDTEKPEWDMPRGAEFIQGDVRHFDSLYKVCDGVDCIFHIASWGMSGAQQLLDTKIESINVGGTKTVIDVCVKRNISKLIYTSSVNVAFGGYEIDDGDEDTVPYFPLEQHVNQYSRTKAIADQMVLAANGTSLNGGGKLHTCVLRPPGIYGPDERRHLLRVVRNIERRMFCFKFGKSSSRMNWVHVSNLIEAEILAAEALTVNKGFVASGQAYYINDGEKVNIFDWLHPLFEKLGYSDPWITLPYNLVYATAVVMEYLIQAIRPVLEVDPILTRNEVMNTGVMHTFRIDKARKELGYNPKKYAFADAVDFYLTNRPKPSKNQPPWSTMSFIIFSLFMCICLFLLI
ncbi:putative short-chain dehydrogenase/reductase family 42E member 2 [Discoglossus pictus]